MTAKNEGGGRYSTFAPAGSGHAFRADNKKDENMDVLKLLRTVCLLVAVGIAAPSTTAAQESGLGGWDWNAEIYGWGANLGGKTTTGDRI